MESRKSERILISTGPKERIIPFFIGARAIFLFSSRARSLAISSGEKTNFPPFFLPILSFLALYLNVEIGISSFRDSSER